MSFARLARLASLAKSVSKAARQRLQWMLFYYFNGRNVRRTCRHFGISRRTFYRWKRRFDRHDLTTQEERSHRPRQVRKPTWTAELADGVLSLRQQYPRWGKDKLAVLLRREKVTVSTSMVGAHPVGFEAPRSTARAAESSRVAAGAAEVAKSSLGHSQA